MSIGCESLTAERPTFVTHLECSATGEHHDALRFAKLDLRKA